MNQRMRISGRSEASARYFFDRVLRGKGVASMEAMEAPMNVVVTINRNYMRPLCVMLRSLLDAHTGRFIDVYILHTELTGEDIGFIRGTLGEGGYALHPVSVSQDFLQDAPVTFHFSREMYFRIFAAGLLPNALSRALYLDPDMVVLRDLSPLYDMELADRFFAAAWSINVAAEITHKLRLQMPVESRYFNSGVLLMNLSLLRLEQDVGAALSFIEQNRAKLVLPDQDTLNALYGSRTALLDPLVYNLDMRYFGLLSAAKLQRFNLETVRRQTAIVHYCGKNKPWDEHYRAPQGVFYREAEERTFNR